MTFLLSLLEVCIQDKNAYNNSLCNLSSIKIQLLMILKKYLFPRI